MESVVSALIRWLFAPPHGRMGLSPVLGLVFAVACAQDAQVEAARADAAGSASGGATTAPGNNDARPILVLLPDGSAPDRRPADLARGDLGVVGCGNGKIDPGLGEVCDDGNNRSGDGCSSDCKTVEKDYICPEPGAPCEYLVACGDG